MKSMTLSMWQGWTLQILLAAMTVDQALAAAGNAVPDLFPHTWAPWVAGAGVFLQTLVGHVQHISTPSGNAVKPGA
jgi:hypothetical protein